MADLEMAGRLKQARDINKLDAPTAAERLRIPYSTYKNYENGDRGFSRYATKFARFYKVDLNWLISGVGQPRPKGSTHPIVEIYEGLPPEKQQRAIEFLDFLRTSKS